MSDVFSKAKRSEVMSRIRSRGNKDTELALVKLFRREKITGWRRQHRVRLNIQRQTSNSERAKLSVGRLRVSSWVRPDFVFPKLKVAVFVDGCFWHVCPKHSTTPKSSAAFWRKKLEANKARDRLVTRALRQSGWRVLRIWEHELTRKWERRLIARLRRCFGPCVD